MELSQEDRQRIYLEEKARDDAKQQIAAEKKRKKSEANRGYWLIALAILFLFIGIGVLGRKGEQELKERRLEEGGHVEACIDYLRVAGIRDRYSFGANKDTTTAECLQTVYEARQEERLQNPY